MGENEESAVRRAYIDAIARGVAPHIAFDLAKAAFRARLPDLSGERLAAAVSRVLVDALKDVGSEFA